MKLSKENIKLIASACSAYLEVLNTIGLEDEGVETSRLVLYNIIITPNILSKINFIVYKRLIEDALTVLFNEKAKKLELLNGIKSENIVEAVQAEMEQIIALKKFIANG